MIPKIKRTVKSFMLDEKGKITKQSLIKMGVALSLTSVIANTVKGGDYNNKGDYEVIYGGENYGNMTAHGNGHCNHGDAWDQHNSGNAVCDPYTMHGEVKDIYAVNGADEHGSSTDEAGVGVGSTHANCETVLGGSGFNHSNELLLTKEGSKVIAKHNHNLQGNIYGEIAIAHGNGHCSQHGDW